MDENTLTDLHNYAWNYFKMHGDQRLKTFNFYLILCTLISAALTSIFKDAVDFRIGIPLALLLPVFSFIFWKLDLRNKQLIGHGEAALKCIENEYGTGDKTKIPDELRIVNHEENTTTQIRSGHLFFTYSTCFNLIFMIFGLGGIVVSLWLWNISP